MPNSIVVLAMLRQTAIRKFCSVIPSRKIQIAIPEIAENIPALPRLTTDQTSKSGILGLTGSNQSH